MERGAGAIAFARWGVGGGPVGVINGQRRTIPGALPDHLRDLRVRDVQAVFDGIAAAVEGALHANAVVGVTRYLSLPPVRFVNDGF